MTRVVAIRPEPGLTATMVAGRKLGLEMVGAPLFEIRPLQWEAPDPERFEALLIGSANAFRNGGTQLERFIEKPAHVVGKATKEAGIAAGFQLASIGSGGLQNVLDSIDPPARLLRVAGAQHVPLDVPEGITIETVIAYESVALLLDPDLIGAGKGRTIILLHSAVAAAHLAAECDRLGVNRASIELAALGPRIASAAGRDWAAIHVSPRPNDADLLAMVRGLCQ